MDDDSDNDNDDDDDNESSSDTSEEEESEAEEAELQSRKRKTQSSSSRKSANPAKAQPKAQPRKKQIRVQLDEKSPKQKKQSTTAKNTNTNAATTSNSGSSGSAPTRRAVHTAMTALAKKVLDPSETPETSLVAALLASYKTTEENDSRTNKRRRGRGRSTGTGSAGTGTNNETMYTAQLEKIARTVIQEHGTDPNKAQVALFNLLFRSVGGTVKTNLDAAEIELEAVSEEEWMELITSIVKEMQTTGTDRILLCADPSGAAHAASKNNNNNSNTGTTSKAHSVGAREYRKIYEEFWYLLGKVALTGSVQDAAARVKQNDDNSDSENDSNDDQVDKADNSRFAVELARDLVARLIEMVGVGQPDIRAAATTAVYQLGTAMLERTVELNSKLQVATRQLSVAKRAKQARKAEALKLQVDSWKRTVAELEEIVKETIMGVFMNRYRDSNMYIRADSLTALGTYTLMRPDIFLVGSYLKYFGWLLSDKAACVREKAILGFLGPFREVANAKTKREASPFDMSNAKSVIEKFLPRLADCVTDVDFQVQERVMELLLVLMREDFLDSLEDDEIWEQINLQAVAGDTTPAVRRDALYFIIDQLEAFDSGPAKTEAKMVERIEGIAQW
jgi:cohesin complex subunit SA-1/2